MLRGIHITVSISSHASIGPAPMPIGYGQVRCGSDLDHFVSDLRKSKKPL